MTNKRIKYFFLASILIQMFVITSLATASPLLSMPIAGEGSMPWGNLMTAILFVLFPLNFLLIRTTRKIHQVPQMAFRICVLASLVLGVLWIPVSFLLTGNWSASFSGQDASSRFWWVYTTVTPLLPFAGYFLMRILTLFFKTK
ncbi:hypothetical protein [Roseivirga sp.]|uniref:hypothetical protein n=1 Tax=Roseivirga sp. TaxID=1964215 RepID=UPI003B52B161